ncbi:MAG: hypothetical protein JJT90_10400 [Ectothiorhodospiraceae bacterium]|nr:hypothetical protein [Ectothiorhodospiraceae bacterium]
MNDKAQTATNNLSPAATGVSVETMDRIAKSVHKGIDNASKAAHPTIDSAAAGAHKAVDSADEMLNPAAEALDRAGVKGEELITASTSYMREHPLLTLGLAVTAGYALSRLLASR